MPVIKRYANRKLYDTEAKRYVTLDDLADFIRRGEDVRVVDYATGDDLTSVTLFQVVFEEEKKIGGLLPQIFLTRLIRAGGDTLNTLRSRLVSLDPFQTVDEEIRRRIQALVEQSRLSEEEGARIQDLLVRKSAQAGGVQIPVRGDEEAQVDAQPGAEQAAPEALPADPEELQALLRQVDMLEAELQRLQSRA